METRPAFGKPIPGANLKLCRNGHTYEPKRGSTGKWLTCKQCTHRNYKIKKKKDPSAGSLRTIAWQKANPEKYKAKQRAWLKKAYDRDPEKFKAKWRKKRDAKARATPSWLTKEQRTEIASIYKRAAQISKSTGIKYTVDHIVPIGGDIASGLHVPWNLQILTLEENSAKGNNVPW
jgi:5-methylcytosine-specific restriction endonuclease McrA